MMICTILPEPSVLPVLASALLYMFVSDAAFPLKTYMLLPYPVRFLPDNKRIFSYLLSRARSIIENIFGMKSTEVHTLGRIWLKFWNIWIENTLHAYVLDEHTSMKNKL